LPVSLMSFDTHRVRPGTVRCGQRGHAARTIPTPTLHVIDGLK